MLFSLLSIYIIIFIIGIFIVSISFYKFSTGFAIWVAIFPIIFSFSTPIGLEKLPPTRIINVIFLLIIIFKLAANNKKVQLGKPERWYIVFVGLSVLSAILSAFPGEALMRAFTYIEPLIWFIAGSVLVRIADLVKSFKRVLIGIIVGFIIVNIFSIIEFALQQNIFIDSGIINQGMYIETIRFGISGRISSTIGQPVYTALYLLSIGTITYFYITHFAQTKSTKLFLYCFLFIAFGVIIFTGTRAAYVGIIIFPLIFLLFHKKQTTIIKLILIYLVLALIFIIILPDTFLSFLSESFRIDYYNKSNANFIARINLTSETLNLFTLSPLLGLGPGYIQKQVFLFHNYDLSSLAGAENQYAILLAENGLLGFLAFIIFIINLEKALRKPIKNMDLAWFNSFKTFVITIIITIMLVSISCSIIKQIPMYYVMLLAGMAIGIQRELSRRTTI